MYLRKDISSIVTLFLSFSVLLYSPSPVPKEKLQAQQLCTIGMIAPSPRGIALLSINAVFCVLAVVAYVLRFLNNLSRARKGSLPWGHFIITDLLVFGATVCSGDDIFRP